MPLKHFDRMERVRDEGVDANAKQDVIFERGFSRAGPSLRGYDNVNKPIMSPKLQIQTSVHYWADVRM
ncbi:hypothetical protein [Paenibacillus sp. LPE1-1-1.1]|uniref:hypothetical protein n=1 Tax=Paenibacillus sp. LPE1-1-1.1 TaxID=3135230 RepID=UPI003428E183